MPFYCVEDDAAHMKVDALICVTSTEFADSCYSDDVFHDPAFEDVRKYLRLSQPHPVGDISVMPGYSLGARHVINIALVKPLVFDWLTFEGIDDMPQVDTDIALSVFQKALTTAERLNCQSIAITIDSLCETEDHGCSLQSIATAVARDYIQHHDVSITFVVAKHHQIEIAHEEWPNFKDFLKKNLYNIYKEEFLPPDPEPTVRYSVDVIDENGNLLWPPSYKAPGLTDRLGKMLAEMKTKLQAPFGARIMQLIRDKGLDEVDVYKHANIDRRLFHKIRKNRFYTPSKETIIALALAMQLDIDETQQLLASAGYTLSDSLAMDLIVKYFIENKVYDIFTINSYLAYVGLDPLGYRKTKVD